MLVFRGSKLHSKNAKISGESILPHRKAKVKILTQRILSGETGGCPSGYRDQRSENRIRGTAFWEGKGPHDFRFRITKKMPFGPVFFFLVSG